MKETRMKLRVFGRKEYVDLPIVKNERGIFYVDLLPNGYFELMKVRKLYRTILLFH